MLKNCQYWSIMSLFELFTYFWINENNNYINFFLIIKPIKKEETKPVIKIEQQKPIIKNVPAQIKKEEPKPMIKINNNPITKNEALPFVNEIVKAKENKEVYKPNNFIDILNNF